MRTIPQTTSISCKFTPSKTWHVNRDIYGNYSRIQKVKGCVTGYCNHITKSETETIDNTKVSWLKRVKIITINTLLVGCTLVAAGSTQAADITINQFAGQWVKTSTCATYADNIGNMEYYSLFSKLKILLNNEKSNRDDSALDYAMAVQHTMSLVNQLSITGVKTLCETEYNKFKGVL